LLNKAVICAALIAAVAVAPAPAARSTSASRCATSGLVVWINTTGDGTAGSIYYKLEFTNQSGRACSLYGYPGVSAVNLSGHRLGSAGGRSATSRPRVITLANGATATTNLQVTEAGNYPSSACHMTNAAGVRVYPPNQTASKVVPFPFQACARSGPVILHVSPVT
jgi:hypothetical protein